MFQMKKMCLALVRRIQPVENTNEKEKILWIIDRGRIGVANKMSDIVAGLRVEEDGVGVNKKILRLLSHFKVHVFTPRIHLLYQID